MSLPVLPSFSVLLKATNSDTADSKSNCSQQDQSTPTDQSIQVTQPQAPKRPPSSYFKYMSEQRQALKPLNLDFKEVKARIDQGWKDLSQEEKEVLKEASRAELQAYNSLHGRPVKPPSAQSLFSEQNVQMINDAITGQETFKKAAARLWKTAVQKPYIDQAALALKSFEKAMEEYSIIHPKKKRKTDNPGKKGKKTVPVKARSAQAIYVAEMKEKSNTVPDLAQFKEITLAQWKSLPAIEKQPYIDKHNEEKKAYVIAKAAYEGEQRTPEHNVPAASDYDSISKIKSLKKSKSMIDPIVLEIGGVQCDQAVE